MHCVPLFAIYTLIATSIHVNAEKVVPENTTDNLRLYVANHNHVVILNAENLTSSIYGSDVSWVVGFFFKNEKRSSDYMEVWKDSADKLRLLSDVRVAAIYCSHDNISKDACSHQNVTSYPTLKYYSPNSKDDSPGIHIEAVNNATAMAENIIELMRKNEKTEHKVTSPNIQHLLSSEEHNLAANKDIRGNSSKKESDWETPSTYIIYIFIGLLVLMMILWSSYSIIKRLSKREVNVYTVLHKSETNDDDSIQVRLKN